MAQKRTSNRKKRVKKANKPDYLKKVSEFFKVVIADNRTRQIAGLMCWLLAAFLGIAFVSYALAGESDQSLIINSSFDFLFDSNVSTKNWMGRFGSFMAHLFFYKGFGIVSVLFIFLLVIAGFKLIYKNIRLSFSRALQYAFWGLLLGSTFMSFIFDGIKTNFPMGGSVGNYINNWLGSFIGTIGTGLFLLFCIAVALIMFFNIQIDFNNLKGFSFSKWLAKNFPEDPKRTKPSKTSSSNVSTSNSNKLPEVDHVINKQQNLTPPESLQINKDIEEGTQLPIDFQAPPGKKGKTKVLNPEDLLLDIKPPSEDSLGEDETQSHDEEGGILAYDPTLDLSNYKLPTVDMLDKYGQDLYAEDTIEVSREELERNKDQIVETLSNYNIQIAKISATPGPTVTLYEIVPAPGVRISKIRNLEDDIALSLAALGIRIIAPMPGKGTIGIEVPNEKKEIVSLWAILNSEKFRNSKMELPIGLGKTISNETYVADLSRMPHLLMAGATGQGKSVCLNSILVSLLYKKHPAELKFVMIDPKKVELSLYNLIEKHFLAKLPGETEAIVTDTKKVINTLNALCIEMDERYELLKKAYVRNIKEYNIKFKQRKLNPEKGHRFLPYFVLVIDEFADLIMTAGKEVEMPIARLAQLARAIGIHLVIATQRPTVNIITGTIKANFPARVAFRVTSKIDSRAILDAGGANQLIGRGDMLISIGGDIIRLQGAFVDTHEVERVVEFIGQQRGYPEAFLLPEYRDDESDFGDGAKNLEFDDLFEDAARIVVQHQSGSTSLLQRRLKLGYNRAGRIMDQLEATSIVGPPRGSKAREVYILDEFELEQFLAKAKAK